MNKLRRADLAEAFNLLDQAKGIVESAASDERDAFDNLPEGFQDSDRGQSMEQAADALDEATEAFAEVVDQINTATET